MAIYYSEVVLTADPIIIDTTPGLVLKDSDCTDSDINASITCNATNTGSGTEDIDVLLKAQVAGALTTFFSFDADGDISIINSAVDGTGNGRNITFQTAAGVDNNDNGGRYVFNYADSAGDGLPSLVVHKKSAEATAADDNSDSVITSYETSGWNTDTNAVVNGSFYLFSEGEDGDNTSEAFGELKFLWANSDFSLVKSFLSLSGTGVNFDLDAVASIGSQTEDGTFVSFEANSWHADAAEARSSYYGFKALANAAGAGEQVSADLAFYNNTDVETLRITDGGTATIKSLVVDREAVTAAVNTDSQSYYFGCDTLGADTITLMTADTVEGRVIVVKDEGGNASAQNITIATEAGELIDGQASLVLIGDYDSVTLVCNGTNWHII